MEDGTPVSCPSRKLIARQSSCSPLLMMVMPSNCLQQTLGKVNQKGDYEYSGRTESTSAESIVDGLFADDRWLGRSRNFPTNRRQREPIVRLQTWDLRKVLVNPLHGQRDRAFLCVDQRRARLACRVQDLVCVHAVPASADYERLRDPSGRRLDACEPHLAPLVLDRSHHDSPPLSASRRGIHEERCQVCDLHGSPRHFMSSANDLPFALQHSRFTQGRDCGRWEPQPFREHFLCMLS